MSSPDEPGGGRPAAPRTGGDGRSGTGTRERQPPVLPSGASPGAPPRASGAPPVVPPRAPGAPPGGRAAGAPPRPAARRPPGSPPVVGGTSAGAPTEPGRLPMDPRIRQRRIDVRRTEGRRRRRVLVGCLAVAAVVAGTAGAVRSPLFDVDYVDVRGAERTARPEVVAAGRLHTRPALLDVDTAAIERAVEALPWVLRATARRNWPGSVRIDVVERRPAAVVPTPDGAWAVADRTGRVLAVGPEKPPGLPAIGGLAPPGPPGTTLPADSRPSLEVAAALSDELRTRIADVAAVGGGEVELQLVAPGGVVRLGPPSELEEKLRVLATVLTRADLAEVATIDVRVPRAPALTRR